MKIAVGYSYYNDLKSIQRSIPTFVNEVDYVIAVDGKYSMREGTDYSTDGSTEYLSEFSNVIIKKFTGMEPEKRNVYLETAKQLDIDVMLIIDSDEYVIESNWDLFKENLNKIQNNPKNFHGIKFYYIPKDWTPYPRIWLRPHETRYGKAHNIFTVNGINPIRSTASSPLVEGIALTGDDSLRSEKWIKDTFEYQKKLIVHEKQFKKR